MPLFMLIFVGVTILATLVRLWLLWRQMSHVATHRATVPAAFVERLSLAEHHKAADYTSAKCRVAMVDAVLDSVVLLGWTLGGGLDWLNQQSLALGWSPLWSGVLLIVVWMVLSSAVGIPIALYRTFGLEAHFGFNKTTPVMFVTDLLKSAVLALLIGTPLVALVLWMMAGLGEYWWVYGWGALSAFQLIAVWAYPTFIAPLFNKFTPLIDVELVPRIEALLARVGFASSGLFVMDASRRSGHGNAYFTGLGNKKRIVFYDTLLAQLTPGQVEAVLAHELGHFKLRHIPKMIAASLGMSLAGFGVLAWLLHAPWFFAGLGVTGSGTALALVLFVLISPVFTLFFDPLSAYWSRRHEFEADAFAVAHTTAADMIGALVILFRENASTLTPDPLYAAWYYSHPPAPERIGQIEHTAV
jgi:STE24 endopeptidase